MKRNSRRARKRRAFYALKRREAQGRAVVRAIRAHMPDELIAPPGSPVVNLVRDEWDLPSVDRMRQGA